MKAHEELFALAEQLERAAESEALQQAEAGMSALDGVALEIGRSFSGSWLGYHAYVYYEDLAPAPPGAHFSQEWGLEDMSFTSMGSRGRWKEYDPQAIKAEIRQRAGAPNLAKVLQAARGAAEVFRSARDEIVSLLITQIGEGADPFLTKLQENIAELEPLDAHQIAQVWSPKGQIMTRDMTAMGQRTRIPPHIQIRAEIASIRQAFNVCKEASQVARKAGSHIERKQKAHRRDERVGTNVFIGHGRSSAWRELKDFVQDRLHLPWDEFNRVPVAGVTNIARLAEMLDAAAVALLIMTAEDETVEGAIQARMNVIHEVGLFQGRLGFSKAIVLLEEGCAEFTNIQGLGQIRFPPGKISAAFEEVRQVLEREGLLSSE